MTTFQVLIGHVLDRLRELPDNSIHCVVTSPPYWGLRDYGVDGQIGLEATPADFVAKMVEVFAEVRRVLRKDGTCFLNMGDSYAASPGQRKVTDAAGPKQISNVGAQGTPSRSPKGLKPKDLIGMPWRLAFALQEDGWYLRQDIIWAKPNPMPESVTDRCTKSHEYMFLLTKKGRYFFDAEAIKEEAVSDAPSGNGFDGRQGGSERVGPQDGGVGTEATWKPGGKRNKRSVWTINTESFPEAHFATFPTKLVEPCILAGTSEIGCCSKCGAQHVRHMVKTAQVDDRGKGSTFDGGKTGARDGGDRTQAGDRFVSVQVGWKASCKCDASIVPPVVLDPFSGSGTTGLVALANRCSYIGIELNPVYAAMQQRRLESATAQGVLL
jgi:DNA modification methylase